MNNFVELNYKLTDGVLGTNYEPVNVVRFYSYPLVEGDTVVQALKDGTLNIATSETSMQVEKQTPKVGNPSVIQALPKQALSDTFTSEGKSQAIEDDEDFASQIPVTVKYCAETAKVKIEKPQSSDEESDPIDSVQEDDPDPIDDPPSPQSTAGIQCYICFKAFKFRKNMYSHIRKIHSMQVEIGNIVCPLCKMKTQRHALLRKHFETLHGIPIVTEYRQFSDMNEFNDWKFSMEKETYAYFIRKSETKLLAQNELATYYKCHRSGGPQIHDKKKIPKTKRPVTSKMPGTCPAALQVTETSSGVSVTFWSTHAGHETFDRGEETNEPIGTANGSAEVAERVNSAINERLASDGASDSDLRLNSGKEAVSKPVIDIAEKWRFKKKAIRPSHRIRKSSQSDLVDKAYDLVQAIETATLAPSDRSTISLMLDNLIAAVVRRKLELEATKGKTTVHWPKNTPSQFSTETVGKESTLERILTGGNIEIKREADGSVSRSMVDGIINEPKEKRKKKTERKLPLDLW